MNSALLSEFVTSMGKIKPRGKTGLQRKTQRKVGKAIRRARVSRLPPLPSTFSPRTCCLSVPVRIGGKLSGQTASSRNERADNLSLRLAFNRVWVSCQPSASAYRDPAGSSRQDFSISQQSFSSLGAPFLRDCLPSPPFVRELVTEVQARRERSIGNRVSLAGLALYQTTRSSGSCSPFHPDRQPLAVPLSRFPSS